MKVALFGLLLALAAVSCRPESAVILNTGPRVEANPNLAQELSLLSKKIQARYATESGLLDYEAIRASEEYSDYRKLAAGLSEFDPATLNDPTERLAFWINLYNAMTIHAVIHFAPEESVRDVPDFFGRASYQVGSRVLSLDDVEHGVLRANREGRFRRNDPRLALALKPEEFDPRVHFTLTCASSSCPPIAFYSAENLERQLELATRNFIQAETRVEGDRVVTSEILRWYGKDFPGGARELLRRYAGEEVAAKLRQRSTRLAFRPYDWSLNSH